ncbi:uL13 family ribosomal protein, partial [Candidatus Parcubacteria bacterium]|nr:uL13 family ribosomal protein [Candidatus Parcubacteria bacterium]
MNRLEKNAVDPATSRPEGRSIPQGAGQKHQSSPASKPKHPGSNGVNIDAARKPVGRLASEIAKILLGKDAATYAPHRTAAT